MAFAYTTQKTGVFGDLYYAIGTFTNGGADTGGDITITNMKKVYKFQIQETGASVQANKSVVNETMPLEGNVVTIVTDADADGTWFALGSA